MTIPFTSEEALKRVLATLKLAGADNLKVHEQMAFIANYPHSRPPKLFTESEISSDIFKTTLCKKKAAAHVEKRGTSRDAVSQTETENSHLPAADEVIEPVMRSKKSKRVLKAQAKTEEKQC